MARNRACTERLPLFDEEMTDHMEESGENPEQAKVFSPTSPLKWSYSKQGVLEQCLRKFYYQYYGANKSKAKGDPEKERLRQLKMAVNRHTRTGEILHLVIADYLRKAQQNTPWERQAWLAWARKIFQRDIIRSREGLDGTGVSSCQHPPKFLVEFLCEGDAREMCREAETEMIAALETFLDAPQIAAAREWGMLSGTLIEKHFYRLEGVPFGVEGQIDLAYQSEDANITIVDWKSGDELGEGDDSLQLAVYALWAKETFVCRTEDIRIYKAYLGSGDLIEFPLTESLLNAARLKILQDAQSFSRMDKYGQEGVVAAFTPCVQEAVCRGCSFATACPEGKESLTW